VQSRVTADELAANLDSKPAKKAKKDEKK
jgi:hypothetical protein